MPDREPRGNKSTDGPRQNKFKQSLHILIHQHMQIEDSMSFERNLKLSKEEKQKPKPKTVEGPHGVK